MAITVVKGNKKLIERYEISLANYRGDSFNFYRQNVSPLVGHKPYGIFHHYVALAQDKGINSKIR